MSNEGITYGVDSERKLLPEFEPALISILASYIEISAGFNSQTPLASAMPMAITYVAKAP